jgi:GNAT superfamily N-acetyltransferase
MAWDDLTGADVTYAPSSVETKRFGVSTARITVGYELDTALDSYPSRLAAVLVQADDDVLIIRYPASAVTVGALIAGSGRDIIPAGALTYWEARIQAEPGLGQVQGRDDLDVVAVSDMVGRDGVSRNEVVRIVNDVVGDSFAGYGNHYLANPLFNRDAALAGYQDWARRSLDSGDTLILLQAGAPIGLATCATSRDGRSHLEILLAGLVGLAQGKGHYAVLLSACAELARARGIDRLIISTQAHNTRVQRAWAKTGLRPFAVVETVHAVRRGLIPSSVSDTVKYGAPGGR